MQSYSQQVQSASLPGLFLVKDGLEVSSFSGRHILFKTKLLLQVKFGYVQLSHPTIRGLSKHKS